MDFLQAAPEQLIGVARQALAHWQWPADSRLELLKLRENAVYGVTAPDGRRAALRLHRPDYHSDAALRSELQWMQALGAHGVPTTRAIAAPDGGLLAAFGVPGDPAKVPVDLLEWVDGQPIGSAENCSFEGDEAIQDMYAEIGRLAAAMHAHSARWTRPPGFVRQSWNLDGCLGPHALWGHYSALEGLTRDELQLFDRAVAVVRAQLHAFGESPHRYGLVHGDLVPDNVMQSPQGLVVLDFDDCGFGWYLWEFTTALFWHIGQSSFDPAWQGYLRGYRSLRALPEEQLQLMPAMFLMRALVYMGWMHTRRETETAAQLREPVRETSVKLAQELLAKA
jgi:Ser/Thr protein kinase RdoA (MazF antagonist)